MKSALKRFISTKPVRPGQRCRCCAMPELSSDLREFLRSRAAGGTRQTLYAFHSEYVLATYSNAPCLNSLRYHASRCLGVDPTTGKPIKVKSR